MTTQATVLEPDTTGPLEPDRTGTISVRVDTSDAARTGSGDAVAAGEDGTARGRLLRRCAAGATVLAILTALLVGWVSQARADTTDRLETLNARIDERVVAGRATAERLATVIVVARNVRAASSDADPEARATLDAAIRSAEGVVGQRVTTQEPATVPQAEMLVEQAGLMQQALALATTDLRTAVDLVLVSRGDLPSEMHHAPADEEGASVLTAVARP
ncbi:hypothetical protein [Myceligenerans xiligouense]|uniref:Uncharacterized protein n=1 Tax=Myceligenerans xiligouense TaxID=253184 RepID=A0A3N4ZSA9_9MICO|nr:hypothetical protein [Myceligenerans xiligouense]RPF22621.1 hypothetical protein EDD34_3289 [Myceligenerans xiligouense]